VLKLFKIVGVLLRDHNAPWHPVSQYSGRGRTK